jgi:hypothetical protein
MTATLRNGLLEVLSETELAELEASMARLADALETVRLLDAEFAGQVESLELAHQNEPNQEDPSEE